MPIDQRTAIFTTKPTMSRIRHRVFHPHLPETQPAQPDERVPYVL
jgi:hypothetical protein